MDAQIECLEEWNTAASAHSVGVELFDRIMADNTKTLLAETVCGAASAVYHTHEGCFHVFDGIAQRVSNEEVRSLLGGIHYGASMYDHWSMPGCGLGSADDLNDRETRDKCEAEANRLFALVAGDGKS